MTDNRLSKYVAEYLDTSPLFRKKVEFEGPPSLAMYSHQDEGVDHARTCRCSSSPRGQ